VLRAKATSNERVQLPIFSNDPSNAIEEVSRERAEMTRQGLLALLHYTRLANWLLGTLRLVSFLLLAAIVVSRLTRLL
jgi:hypothetical protein